MKITDFNSKQQAIIREIAERIKPNKAGLKNFFIPICLDRCKHLEGFEPKDIAFLKKYPSQVVYLGAQIPLMYQTGRSH